MTDEKKIIKEAIDDIKPDVYMKTRLQAKIEEPKRKSAKSFLKPALSCTLALAVLAGVGTYGMTRDNTPVTSQTSNAKLSSHSFNMRRIKTEIKVKILHLKMMIFQQSKIFISKLIQKVTVIWL